MLNMVVSARNIKLVKRSLGVSLYYCQERHGFESSTGQTQRLLLPDCSGMNEQNQCFFEEMVLQSSLDVH